MFVRELVEQHGLPVRVSCGKEGYPPFTVIKRISENEFRAEYGSGKTFVLNDCLDDYEIKR